MRKNQDADMNDTEKLKKLEKLCTERQRRSQNAWYKVAQI
jgi:hypothetical protein